MAGSEGRVAPRSDVFPARPPVVEFIAEEAPSQFFSLQASPCSLPPALQTGARNQSSQLRADLGCKRFSCSCYHGKFLPGSDCLVRNLLTLLIALEKDPRDLSIVCTSSLHHYSAALNIVLDFELFQIFSLVWKCLGLSH